MFDLNIDRMTSKYGEIKHKETSAPQIVTELHHYKIN